MSEATKLEENQLDNTIVDPYSIPLDGNFNPAQPQLFEQDAH